MIDPAVLIERLLAGVALGEDPVTHIETLPRSSGETADWPVWVPDAVRTAVIARGVGALWTHQARAASLAHDGHSVVIATGTASGKSLAYQLPALAQIVEDDRARVLYLSPTKALAGDQLRALRGLDVPGLRAATYDGDTPIAERDWVRAHANWILTNPDMLHRGILPAHARWASVLRRLRLVVIDECHTYRGLFGSHVAQVLRRLRRVCALYRSDPVFVLASATAASPARSASRLVGSPVTAVDTDSSPRAARTFALWEPPLDPGAAPQGADEHSAPVRRSAGSETARILADLVVEGARTLAFVRSRRGAEFAALAAARHLTDAGLTDLAPRIAAYRAGYLPEERRAVEAALVSGELLGVAATNALELGLDIAGLDAVVLAGYPGTLASLWQQAGRAGRSGAEALVIFVARDDPLDTYLVHHPEAVFGRPVEATVLDPTNPYVLGPQLMCAAAEAPIRTSELAHFALDPVGESPVDGSPVDGSPVDGSDEGRDTAPVEAALNDLTARGLLRRRPGGWFWTHRERPDVDIRGAGGRPFDVVEGRTGSLIGTVDPGAAHGTLHDGAVYLHQGRVFVVDSLDLDEKVALVHPESPPWSTTARDVTDIRIVQTLVRRDYGPLAVCFGTVDVANQVVSYSRRRLGSNELMDEVPLDLPPRELQTAAVWYTVTQPSLDDAGLDLVRVPGAAHAAEHAAIGLLPLFATCDRWDIGGVSTALHPDTGCATVFVYDGHPGGAGFARRGHDAIGAWLEATREAIEACECPAGCPSCVQSPKCGNGNEPLDKAGAVVLLGLVLNELRRG